VLSIWLHYIPIPVLVLLVLLPGIEFRTARHGKRRATELQVRWPWWRRP
jgi:hypothetical protein